MKRLKINLLLKLVVIIISMGVSYAYFSTTLYVNGVASFDGNFNVIFADVQ